MKRVLFFIVAIYFLIPNLKASHILGGEISWECMPNGQYVFYTTLFRDCNQNTASFPYNTINLKVFNTPRPNNNTLSEIILNYVTPQVGTVLGPNGGIALGSKCDSCYGKSLSVFCELPNGGSLGAIEKFVFRSQPITLNGKPPSGNTNPWLNGWVFVYAPPCCRSNSIQNLVNKSGAIFKAIMYGDGRSNQNACYDNAPVFAEDPSIVACEGVDFSFFNASFDNEGDSLVYRFENVMDGPSYGTNFIPQFNSWENGFSVNNPTPTQAMNPLNKSATINAETGELNFKAFLPSHIVPNGAGYYIASIRVDAYAKNSLGNPIRTASFFRDMPIFVKRCDSINFSYQDSLNNTINYSSINYPPYFRVDGQDVRYIDTTIYAGDSLDFLIDLLDSNMSLCTIDYKSKLLLQAKSNQYDSTYTNVFGNCANPPCATLNSSATQIDGEFVDFGKLSSQFNWKTSCDHLDIVNGKRVPTDYIFNFKGSDGFCPIPSNDYVQLRVRVLSKDLEAPEIFCIDSTNQQYTITFDPYTFDSTIFKGTEVYVGERVLNSTSPFVYPATANYSLSYGSGSFQTPKLDSTKEYAFKLKYVYAFCNNLTYDTSEFSLESKLGLNYGLNMSIQLINDTLFSAVKNASHYQWYNGSQPIINANSSYYVPTVSGNYTLELSYSSCAYFSNVVNVTFTNINELPNNENLIIYPNPSDGLLTVELKDDEIKEIHLYSAQGKLLKQVFNTNKIHFDEFDAKIYLLKVIGSQHIYSKKVIKK